MKYSNGRPTAISLMEPCPWNAIMFLQSLSNSAPPTKCVGCTMTRSNPSAIMDSIASISFWNTIFLSFNRLITMRDVKATRTSCVGYALRIVSTTGKI